MFCLNSPLKTKQGCIAHKEKLESDLNLYGKVLDLNLCTISDGVIDWVYQGTPEECNNAVFHTYNDHLQIYPKFVNRILPRADLDEKVRGSIRYLLSMASRSKFRPKIKASLKSKDIENMLITLSEIPYYEIDDIGNKKFDIEFFKRKTTFQMYQVYKLLQGEEIFTKRQIIKELDHKLVLQGQDRFGDFKSVYKEYIREIERYICEGHVTLEKEIGE